MAFVLILSKVALEKNLQTGPRGRFNMDFLADTGACVGVIGDKYVAYTSVKEVRDDQDVSKLGKLGDFGDERVVGVVKGAGSRQDFEVIDAYGAINKSLAHHTHSARATREGVENAAKRVIAQPAGLRFRL